MLPFVTYGIADASTTRRPSTPCTRIVVGSNAARSTRPDRTAPAPVRDAHRAGALEDDPFDEGAGADLQVGTARDRMEVGARRGQSPSSVDVPIERAEPLLAVPVDVVGQLVAGLLYRLEECSEQRALGRSALQDERAAVPAIPVV